MRGWLTAKPDPAFERKCAEVCAVYHQAVTATDPDRRTIYLP